MSGTVGLGVLRLTSPRLPGETEIDVVGDRGGPTVGAGHNARYQELDRLGFRDVLALLEAGGARLTLRGFAELRRESNAFGTWVAVPVLATCEGVLAAAGADVIGRHLGGQYDDPPATTAAVVALGLVAVVAGVVAMPCRALFPATRASKSVLSHYDTMSWRPEARMDAVFAAALPFLRPEPNPDGRVYAVVPWQPGWRLPALAAGMVTIAVATANDPDPGAGWAGGVVGAIARLATVVLVVVMYFLPSSGPVEVSVRTADRVRKATLVMYAAFWVCGITALVIAN